MTNTYLTVLPMKMLRKLAGYSVKEGSYYLPRANIQSPESLLRSIFPFVEEWDARFKARAAGKKAADGGLDEDDTAGQAFVGLLQRLRVVLLQDLALMQLEFPQLPHFKQLFADHPDWQPFAAAVRLANESVEINRSQHLEAWAPELSNALYSGQETILNHLITNHNILVSMLQQALEGMSFLQNQFPLIVTFGKPPLPLQSEPNIDPQLLTIPPTNPSTNPPTQTTAPPTISPTISQPLTSYPIPPNPQAATGLTEHPEPIESQMYPPNYSMQNVMNVDNLWREWKTGIGGGPAVEQLEKRWGAKWRSSGKDKTSFSRKKAILNEIQGLINSGMPSSMAVDRVEKMRGTRSLYKLSLELAKKRKGY